MFKIVVSPQAAKELKALKKLYQVSINNAFLEIKEDPHVGKALSREFTGKFSYKIGVYRIIYKINKKDKIVNVLSVGHRSNIYN